MSLDGAGALLAEALESLGQWRFEVLLFCGAALIHCIIFRSFRDGRHNKKRAEKARQPAKASWATSVPAPVTPAPGRADDPCARNTGAQCRRFFNEDPLEEDRPYSSRELRESREAKTAQVAMNAAYSTGDHRTVLRHWSTLRNTSRATAKELLCVADSMRRISKEGAIVRNEVVSYLQRNHSICTVEYINELVGPLAKSLDMEVLDGIESVLPRINVEPNGQTYEAFVRLYFVTRNFAKVAALAKDMRARNVTPTTFVQVTLLKTALQTGNLEEAIDCYRELRSSEASPADNVATVTTTPQYLATQLVTLACSERCAELAVAEMEAGRLPFQPEMMAILEKECTRAKDYALLERVRKLGSGVTPPVHPGSLSAPIPAGGRMEPPAAASALTGGSPSLKSAAAPAPAPVPAAAPVAAQSPAPAPAPAADPAPVNVEAPKKAEAAAAAEAVNVTTAKLSTEQSLSDFDEKGKEEGEPHQAPPASGDVAPSRPSDSLPPQLTTESSGTLTDGVKHTNTDVSTDGVRRTNTDASTDANTGDSSTGAAPEMQGVPEQAQAKVEPAVSEAQPTAPGAHCATPTTSKTPTAPAPTPAPEPSSTSGASKRRRRKEVLEAPAPQEEPPPVGRKTKKGSKEPVEVVGATKSRSLLKQAVASASKEEPPAKARLVRATRAHEEDKYNHDALGGQWVGARSELYELEAQGAPNGIWTWSCERRWLHGTDAKPFSIQYDEEYNVYWWGSSKKYFVDSLDLKDNPAVLTWFNGDDWHKQYPVFVWHRHADGTSTKFSATSKVKSPATDAAPSTSSAKQVKSSATNDAPPSSSSKQVKLIPKSTASSTSSVKPLAAAAATSATVAPSSDGATKAQAWKTSTGTWKAKPPAAGT